MADNNTTPEPAQFNSALYNPTSNPSRAVGFLPDFGDGSDGNLSVGGGSTLTVDTGDTPNAAIGNPFTVQDLNPGDVYNPTSVSPGPKTYDSFEYFDLKLASLTVSPGGTLRVIGMNPILFRVSGVVQVAGHLDASGGDGADAAGFPSAGGVSGAGGGAGADSKVGVGCIPSTSTCQSWSAFIQGGCSNVAQGGPYSQDGVGPGRGMAGGEAWSYAYDNIQATPISGTTGTGGGGASHATVGTAGEDRNNAGGAIGRAHV